jgi:hypothetical protein
MSIADIAKKGRYGDNHLLHVSDAEVQGLNALANKAYGHGLTTNPETGLPEAFLLAPFIAPFLTGGMGLLGTMATTGAAAAGEAALRGYDDPLKHGMFSALTAGAGSALGSSLDAAAGADAALQAGAEFGTDAATQNMLADQALKMSADPALQTTLTQDLLANPNLLTATPDVAFNAGALQQGVQGGTINSVASQMTPGATQIGMGGSLDAMPYGTTPDLSYGMRGGVGMAQNVPNPSIEFTADATGAIPKVPTTTPTFGESMANKYQGLQNVTSSGENISNFLKDNSGALTTGMIGLGGQSDLEYQQGLRESAESSEAARKAEADAKRKAIQDQITANYAAVGRPMPTGPYGGSLFAEGGTVYSEAVPKPNFDEELDKLSLPELRRLKGMIQQYQSDLNGAKPMDWQGTGNSMDDALIQEHGGKQTKFSEGGLASLNFNKARGFAAGGQAYTTNIYGDKIPYDNTITSGESSNRFGSIFENLFSQMFAKAGITPDVAGQQNAYSDKHNALVGKLQTGMGNQQAMSELKEEGYAAGGDIRRRTTGGIGFPTPYLPPYLTDEMAEYVPKNSPGFMKTLYERYDLTPEGEGEGEGEAGGEGTAMANGGYLETGGRVGDGMSDDIPATIDGTQPAALSDGEFVIPADVVSHLGNGSSDAGAQQLYDMMDRIRQARTGTKEQGKEINAKKMLPS